MVDLYHASTVFFKVEWKGGKKNERRDSSHKILKAGKGMIE